MKTLLSSEKMDWETPPEIFDDLQKEFNFTLDPCASSENAKCEKFFTEEDNGLIQDWSNERVFVNPPYGSAIKEWVKKCFQERNRAELIVMLIPARTDTTYFHDYIYHKAEIRFIKGRIKFLGNQKGSGSAPFPSMLVIFNAQNQNFPSEFSINGKRHNMGDKVTPSASPTIPTESSHHPNIKLNRGFVLKVGSN